MLCHKGATVSSTLQALSHSIRLRTGVHTRTECVLWATYLGRGTGRARVRGVWEWRERPDRVTYRLKDRTSGSGGEVVGVGGG